MISLVSVLSVVQRLETAQWSLVTDEATLHWWMPVYGHCPAKQQANTGPASLSGSLRQRSFFCEMSQSEGAGWFILSLWVTSRTWLLTLSEAAPHSWEWGELWARLVFVRQLILLLPLSSSTQHKTGREEQWEMRGASRSCKCHLSDGEKNAGAQCSDSLGTQCT